jgi:hypothetical protein
MAKTKAKRSIRKKQSARRGGPNQLSDNRKFVQFRQTEGKTVETVDLLTAPDYHTISINFRDKTCLHFSIETGFTVKTDYSDWKTARSAPFASGHSSEAISFQQSAISEKRRTNLPLMNADNTDQESTPVSHELARISPACGRIVFGTSL